MKLLFILLSAGSFLLDHGASFADSVSGNKGDSVTLHTGVKKKQEDRIRWYYDGILVAKINGDPSKTCTDVQCKGGDERFRGRVKLDNQTGSLTIMNITDTDSGVYELQINSGSEKTFIVSVHEVKRKSVKEGESVTLVSDVKRNPNDLMMWHFNDIRITGDQRKICTDVQCKERFRDRLKLDHLNGSLTITNTRNTDSGEYKLQISSGSNRRRRSASNNNMEIFEVTVTGSGLSVGAVAGIVVVLLGFVAVAGVIYYRRRGPRHVVEEKQPRASEEIPINEMEKDRGHVI